MNKNLVKKLLVFIISTLTIFSAVTTSVNALSFSSYHINKTQITVINHHPIKTIYNNLMWEDNIEDQTYFNKMFKQGYNNKHSIGKEPLVNEYVNGIFIVKISSAFAPLTIRKINNVVKTGISSIDALNERYNVIKVEQIFNDKNSKDIEKFGLNRIYTFTYKEEMDVLSVVAEYEKDENIEYAEPNYIYRTCDLPNDEYFDTQWALHNTGQTGGSPDADIDAPEAWDIETGSENIVIAIIDTGVDYKHIDLADNIWVNKEEKLDGNDTDGNGYIDDKYGWDFINYNNDPLDDNGHGTHCSGIISAVTNNEIGVAGISWNIKIMSLKGLYKEGYAPDKILGEAIYYAADNGANIISMSWGGYSYTEYLHDVIEYAYSQNCMLIAAAGNNNINTKSYPAAYEEVISVAATDDQDKKASFSNYGDWIDITAPGVDILSLRANGTDMYGDGTHIVDEHYYIASGTSMACPHVAGLLGLIISKNSNYTSTEIKAILKSATDPVSSDEYIGFGRINAYNAVLRDSIANAKLNNSISENELIGVVPIIGTANSSSFTYFTLSFGKGYYPVTWTELSNESIMVNDNLLEEWNTTYVKDGTYILRLKVFDTNGLFAEDRKIVIINNYLETFYVGGNGPSNYSTIRNAYSDSQNGDTIFVYHGIYTEHLVIKKTINLIGENKHSTIVTGGGTGKIFTLNADRTNISGFTIQNGLGAYQLGSIWIYSDENIISQNIFTHNYYGDYAMHLVSTQNNIIVYNTFQRQGLGGIRLYNSSNNTIENNNFRDNIDHAIELCRSDHNQIKNNSIAKNGIGIVLTGDCNTNVISGNIIINNGYGVVIDHYYPNNFSVDNYIHHNYFVLNINPAYDSCSNLWDDGYPNGGNYWDDYNGEDDNGDGIGDIPYPINGNDNQDNYPLMKSKFITYAYGPYYGEKQKEISFYSHIDGGISPYEIRWGFGDGSFSEENNPSYKYNEIGVYNITLTVTDKNGIIYTDMTQVRVIHPPNSQLWVDDDFNETTSGWQIDHFNRLQDAVYFSGDKSNIDVNNGIYKPIIIDKTLTLNGYGKYNTVIDGGGSDYAVKIFADKVIISRFSLQNSSELIHVLSDNNTIKENSFNNCGISIIIQKSHTNNIISNSITNVFFPILLQDSKYNNLENNTISSSIFEAAIGLKNSSYNIITGNLLYDNEGFGIYIKTFSNFNIVQNNHLNNNMGGVLLFGPDPYQFVHDNHIKNNEIIKNIIGVYVSLAYGNKIYNNNFIDNDEHASFTLYMHLFALFALRITGNIEEFRNYMRFILTVKLRNNWNNNYWDDWNKITPHKIKGYKTLIPGLANFDWVNYDWHPARQQFDL